MIRKYRMTLLFALTAALFTTVAVIVANRIIGDLAEDNLIRIAEENTGRNAKHLMSMMSLMGAMEGRPSMQGTASADSTGGDRKMREMQQPMAMTLEYLASPGGVTK